MPDQISEYRVIRLALHVPSEGGRLAHWSLIFNTTRRGVPHAEVMATGMIPLQGPAPSYEQVLEAIDGIVGPQLLA